MGETDVIRVSGHRENRIDENFHGKRSKGLSDSAVQLKFQLVKAWLTVRRWSDTEWRIF
jgi:hypothetical protein